MILNIVNMKLYVPSKSSVFILLILFLVFFINSKCWTQHARKTRSNETSISKSGGRNNSHVMSSPLPNTEVLILDEPLHVLMQERIHRFLGQQIATSKKPRTCYWNL